MGQKRTEENNEKKNASKSIDDKRHKKKTAIQSKKNKSSRTNKKKKTKRPSAQQEISNVHRTNKKSQNESKKNPKKITEIRTHTKMLHVLWNVLFYVAILSILVGASLMAVMQQQNKSLNGYRMFGVLTDSMVSPDNSIKKGGFRSGDILITKEVEAKSIKVGDVITYRPSTNPTNASTNFLTHRVVKVNDHLGNEEGIFFVTRGDANQSDDMPISSTALIGKEIFVIPKVGGVLAFIKANWLLSLIFILSFLGFIWVMRSYIFTGPTYSPSNNKKKRTKKRP